jgi:hypothetical protein
MPLSHQELAWSLPQLEELEANLPNRRFRNYPFYDATSWDLDDLFCAFQQDMCSSRDLIWSALLERVTLGIWPNLPKPAFFWLRQRLAMAIRYCRTVLEKSLPSDPIPANRPKDAPAAIKWLVLDLWDERLAELWLRENAREYVVVSWPEDDNEYELERYLQRLETE